EFRRVLFRSPVRKDIAMTGEITLRGRIHPIGGLKEKAMAAYRGGIKKVIIPTENQKDIREIPAVVRKNLELIPVDHMDQVLKLALAIDDPEKFFRKPLPGENGEEGGARVPAEQETSSEVPA